MATPKVIERIGPIRGETKVREKEEKDKDKERRKR
jgi:hypothetical protein